MLTQLWDYCRAVIHASDTPKKPIQVVFLDTFLSSTVFPQNFLDVRELVRIIKDLRATFKFELFGMDGPGKEDSVAFLKTLATWYSQHQRAVSPSLVTATPPDTSSRKRWCPHRHYHTTPQLTPVASVGTADHRRAVKNITVSKLDSVVRVQDTGCVVSAVTVITFP